MQKTIIITGIVAASLLVIWIVVGYVSLANVKEPDYTVIEKTNGYEIREYPTYIIAETENTGTYNEAINNNFRAIAGFIFGDNTKQTSVAMTTPVINEKSEPIAMTAPVITEKKEESYTMSFVMPKEYTLETLPSPNNNKVKIREVPAHKTAVLRFTGFSNEKRVNGKKAKLESLLQENNIQFNPKLTSAFYNTPWHFPWLRRNEIWAEIQ